MVRLLIYLLFFIMLITNDSASILSVPIASFHILLKDIFLYSLLFIYTVKALYIKKIKTGYFYKHVLVILTIYYLFIPWGLYNGNSWDKIFYNLRQINYILVYFPLIAYLHNKSPKQVLHFSVIIIMIEALLTIILSYIYYGKLIEIRTEFFWIDNPQSELRFSRILMASSTFFPSAIITLIYLIQKKATLKKKNIAILLIILIVALSLTFSRSLWIGMVVCFITAFLLVSESLYWRIRTIFKGFIFLISISIFLFAIKRELFFNIIERFTSIFNFEMMSNFDRINEMKAFIGKIIERPLLGFGQGSSVELYLYSFGEYIDTPFSHNSYLIYLLNFGIIGTLIIIAAFVSYFITNLRTAKRLSGFYCAVKIGLDAGFLGLLVVSFVTSNITYTSGCFFMGVFFALQNKLLEQSYVGR